MRPAVQVSDLELEEWRHAPRLATAVLGHLARQRRSAEASKLLRRMAGAAVETNVYHFGAAISACEKAKDWQTAIHLLATMRALRVNPNVIACSAAVSSCEGHWPLAVNLLQAMIRDEVLPNVVTYNGALHAVDAWPQALMLLSSMRQEAVTPDAVSFNTVCAACGTGGVWQLSLHVLREMEMAEVPPDVISYNTAMDVCHKSGRWQHALALFSSMDKASVPRDVITMNTAMLACSKASHWQHALGILSGMPAQNLIPTAISYNTAITACDSWESALAIFSSIKAAAVRSFNSLMGVLQKCAQWQLALHILWSESFGGKRDVVSFNAAMSACDKAGQWRSALWLLGQMSAQSLADEVSYSTAISACDKVGQWEAALGLLAFMNTARVVADTYAFNAAMAACAAMGRWQWAVHLLHTVCGHLQPDVTSFNAVACKCSDWVLSLTLIVDMMRRSVGPNHITFTSALAAVDRWPVAVALLELMGSLRVDSADAEDLAVSACCQDGAWPAALWLLQAKALGPSPGVTALLMSCEQDGLPELETEILRRLAGGMPRAAASALLVSGPLATFPGRGLPPLARSLLASANSIQAQPYAKELALLAKVISADPGPNNVLQAMDSYGEELGEAGSWAKFAGGSKAQALLAAARGAAKSSGAVLEIGTYCGYSAVSLAAATSATVTTLEMDPVLVAIARCVLAQAGLAQKVRVWTGHSQRLLPRMKERLSQTAGFDVIFMDRWGSQYPEDLEQIERLKLLACGGVLVADNVLRTVAAHFLWQTCQVSGKSSRYASQVVPVNEVGAESDEDWMSVSVLLRAGAAPDPPPSEWTELQKLSDLMRVRTTSSFVPRAEIQEVKARAKRIFLADGVGPT
ncbi:unnamed protein product [Effrenium voratum]|nr:unnamed protein product [Effrenium voratum]